MELQEKINKRIEQLEAELEQLNNEFRGTDSISTLNKLDKEITTVEVCIKELKQLLNN